MDSLSFKKVSHAVGFFIIMLLAAVAMSRFNVAQADTSRSQSEHLLTIHDRGHEQTVITKRSTLREVFKEANITLDERDVVEPGLDQELTDKDYQVNVYRARPVTIVDGSTTIRVMSAAQTPKLIARDGGITLQDEDIATLSLPQEKVLDSGASVIMRIKRAIPIEFVLYGKHERAYTQATTVQDLLKEKSVTLGREDSLSVPLSAKIFADMKIQLWRNGKQTVTVDEAVDFPIERVQDSSRYVGYSKITTAGVKGKRSVTYEIVMKNGKEVSRKKIQSVTLKKPVKQVMVVGTKQKSVGGSCGQWMAAAGITDNANATYLINAESGCNPNAVNPSTGACGVGQALPCSKTGCSMGDGYCQTKWMNGYVMGRYGSWQAAADHHRANGWY